MVEIDPRNPLSPFWLSAEKVGKEYVERKLEVKELAVW